MRLHLLLAFAAPLTLTACLDLGKGDDDDDDDGGSGDSDGDGLSDSEEEDLGTDPDDEDSDGDGISDGDEVDAGTSPSNPYSMVYAEGGYNVGSCDELPDATEPTGGNNGYGETWAAGDVASNFTLVDQYGQDVHLYSFCGQNVMLVFSAEWCGPCQQLAATLQAEQDHYGPDGFQAIEILIEDNGGNAPDQETLQRWASDYDLLTIPVLADGGYEVWPYYELDWGIPTVVHIGPDMTVLSVDDYVYDPGEFIE